MKKIEISKDLLIRCLFMVLAGWYLILCFHHYMNQRPMWNDEECVYRSIRTFSGSQIFTKTLEALQVFPRLYLFLIQQWAHLFQDHLLALRFFPFLAMMASFVVWQKIVRFETKNPWMILLFTAAWPSSTMLIYYSAELKQYSMDVFCAGIFFYFLQRQTTVFETNQKRYMFWLLSLPLLGLFSYPAIICSMLVGINLLILTKRDFSHRKYLLIYSGMILVVLATSYWFDMRLRPVAIVTEGFGDYFISLKSLGEFFKTWGEGTSNLLTRWFGEQPKWVKKMCIPIVFLGFAHMAVSFFTNCKKSNFLINSLPIIGFIVYLELFFLGLLRKYPFTVPRTALFFAPILLFFISDAIIKLKGRFKFLGWLLLLYYLMFLVMVSFALARLVFDGDLGAIPRLY